MEGTFDSSALSFKVTTKNIMREQLFQLLKENKQLKRMDDRVRLEDIIHHKARVEIESVPIAFSLKES